MNAVESHVVYVMTPLSYFSCFLRGFSVKNRFDSALGLKLDSPIFISKCSDNVSGRNIASWNLVHDNPRVSSFTGPLHTYILLNTACRQCSRKVVAKVPVANHAAASSQTSYSSAGYAKAPEADDRAQMRH